MNGKNIVQKVLEAHNISDKPITDYKLGDPIFVNIDQCITQDATGTMAWLEFEAINIPEVKVPLVVSYIDHNMLQTDFRNADDHQFLQSIAAKKGAILSKPGNGIIHQVHLENFARPGKIMLGTDSHTPTGGGVGSLAIGVGGLVVATVMAGEPFELKYPKVVKVNLTGKLNRPWVTAMDVILELLKLRGVKGGLKSIFEYSGPGVKDLTAPERATITNMGAELGATTSIFPSDELTKHFLKAQDRELDYTLLVADDDAKYDEVVEIDLSKVEPNVALPHSPGSVVKIRELVEQIPVSKLNERFPNKVHEDIKTHVGRLYERDLLVDQVCVGSCTNASYLALATTASILKDQTIAINVSMTVSPGSKNVFTQLAQEGILTDIIGSGARILESGCGPCIGMGQTPPTNGISVRTFNRNFYSRTGEKTAGAYLMSPTSASLIAIKGKFVDPLKEKTIKPKIYDEPDKFITSKNMFIYPSEDKKEREKIEIIKGPNIVDCPINDPLASEITSLVLLKTKDDITTDDIMMAGAKVLPLRSNIPAIAQFVFNPIDELFVIQAKKLNPENKRRVFIVVGGNNYGQGSSREHAAIAPMWLGLGAVIAKSIARIHRDNLIQWGMLPLEFVEPKDYDNVSQEDTLVLKELNSLKEGISIIEVENKTQNLSFKVKVNLSSKEIEMLSEGGALPLIKSKLSS
ncbi:MAG: aconitate hydratase [Candidatus Heimdallarchaeota archaeon]|nr:aconitate hydratase [Candidatus Heimdallarchaeota archaeon]MBY8994076.1 aconitate hydratase [Candidatus Heimdallarchaeota archaeon]